MKKVLFLACLALAPLFAHADTVTANLLTNPGAETGDLTGWTNGLNPSADHSAGIDQGTFNPGINPRTGTSDFYGANGAFASLSQTVNLLASGVSASAINSGQVTADVSFAEQGLNQGTPSDSGQVQIFFLDASDNVLGSFSSGEVDSHNGAWQLDTTLGIVVPAGTVAIDYEMDFIRHDGTADDAYIDDNSLVLDTASNTAPPSVTPEPSSFVLLGTGVLGLASAARRRISR